MDEHKHSEFATCKEACSVLHVTPDTLRRWEREGKIQCTRTPGGHRKYNLRKFLGGEEARKRYIIYARVSGGGQREDLQRQVELLKSKYPNHELVTDIGSGLNFKRKGLRSLVASITRGEVQELVVTHKDRLCRFGFELFTLLMSLGNAQGKILVLCDQKSTPEGELVEDVLAILTSFSGRVHGLRSHRNAIRKEFGKDKNPEDQALSG